MKETSSGVEVPPVEAFFPLTSLMVLAVLWLAKPEVFLDLEVEAQRLVGPSTRPVLCCYALIALLLAVAIVRACFYLVAQARRRSKESREHAATLEKERAALESLFANLNGKAWKSSTNWCSSTAPIRTWKGVFINHSTGRVAKLVLSYNNLSCDDFSSAGAPLGDLLHLEELDLRGNALSGPLPHSLCLLRRMQGLYLYDNHLSADVPAKLIINLKNSLKGIYLFNNHFENMDETRELCAKELDPDCLVYL